MSDDANVCEHFHAAVSRQTTGRGRSRARARKSGWRSQTHASYIASALAYSSSRKVSIPVSGEVDMKISDGRMSTRPPQVPRPRLRSMTTERGREVLRQRSRVLSRRPPPPCVTSDGRETVGLTDQVNQRS